MRLTKIYTKQGDNGTTGLASGERIKKSSHLICCIGTTDHCNSVLGWARCQLPAVLQQHTQAIQNWLFDIGGELALPDYVAINADHVSQIEAWIDEMNPSLKPLKEFILPGGSEAAARVQIFRSEIRRLERELVALQEQEQTVNSVTLQLVNRLSDWAFVAARFCNLQEQVEEPYWQHSVPKPNN